MKKDNYAIILAGGSGSRLWPLSRELYPKQLLNLDKGNTLFQSTFLRLVSNFADQNILSITNIKHSSDVKMQLSKLKNKLEQKEDYKVITEPIGRNTAPAIALAAKYVQNIDKEADPVILITPSDQVIKDSGAFSVAINEGLKLAAKGYIVTFGIVPEREETGFGYIKAKKSAAITKISDSALKAAEFKEKPDLATARKYIKAKNYYWNGGIFMFKASVLLKELEKYSPEIIDVLSELDIKETQPTVDFDSFSKMPDISIDYAVMEKSDKIALVPLDCGWNDLGSWEALYDISKKDKNGNYITGNVIDIGSKNSMVYSTSKLVTTLGLKNKVVVETDDALLVCDKSRTQDVKKIYSKLKEDQNSSIMVHKTVYRPWGYYTVLNRGKGFLTKCIQVNPGAKLSLQLHHHRSEHWVVLEGKALVVKGEQEHKLEVGGSINIGIEEKHSLQNPYNKPLKILEVQRGKVISEDDIVRLDDIYGRVPVGV